MPPGSVATIVVVVAAATVSAATVLTPTPAPPAKSPLIAAASPPRSNAYRDRSRERFGGLSSPAASERRARKIRVSTADWVIPSSVAISL